VDSNICIVMLAGSQAHAATVVQHMDFKHKFKCDMYSKTKLSLNVLIQQTLNA
jgi:hypothetical protein